MHFEVVFFIIIIISVKAFCKQTRNKVTELLNWIKCNYPVCLLPRKRAISDQWQIYNFRFEYIIYTYTTKNCHMYTVLTGKLKRTLENKVLIVFIYLSLWQVVITIAKNSRIAVLMFCMYLKNKLHREY